MGVANDIRVVTRREERWDGASHVTTTAHGSAQASPAIGSTPDRGNRAAPRHGRGYGLLKVRIRGLNNLEVSGPCPVPGAT
jgi:hypothetical protein